jgi:hypothetical protein
MNVAQNITRGVNMDKGSIFANNGSGVLNKDTEIGETLILIFLCKLPSYF